MAPGFMRGGLSNSSIIKIVSKSTQSNSGIFVILSIVVISLLTETSLVKTYNLTGSASASTYLIMVFVFIFGQYYFLDVVSRKSRAMQAKVRPYNLWHKIVRIVQYTLSGILLFVFLQMLATSHYSTIMLILVMSISYTLVGIMLGILAQRFFSWYIRHRTLVVLVYGLSATALAINSGFTLGFVTSTLSKMFDIVGDHTDVFSYIAVPGSLEYLLYSGSTVFSILSFVLTWLATAFLLYPYSKKFGRIKYWTIISLPLVYFLSQFPSVFLDLFTPLLNSDPIFYGIFLSVIFTLSKAAGGILFGASFWTMSRSTPNVALRDYLVIAAIGFVLLFVSDQGLVLLSVPYPPLGLASVSFMGLSSYLILIGIYSSAIYISQDAKLRQSIRNVAIRESKLLDSIGMAHMEKEIERNVKVLVARNQDTINEETGIHSSETEEGMKEYLQQVLDEVKSSKEHSQDLNDSQEK